MWCRTSSDEEMVRVSGQELNAHKWPLNCDFDFDFNPLNLLNPIT
jgi:hypothetical protein